MRRRTAYIPVAVVVLLLVLLPFSCYHSIDVPLGAVDRIEVTDNMGETVSVVTDPARIAQVATFLRSRRHFWYTSWHTFPGPQYTAACLSGGEYRYVVWIGRDGAGWIGFRGDGDSRDNLLRDVSEAERIQLLSILGIRTGPTTATGSG